MAVTRVGAAMYGGTYSQAPTAGNLLTLAVFVYSSNGFPGTPSATTPTGWTAGPSATVYNGNIGTTAGFYMFWKVAAGGDAVPGTIATAPGNTARTIVIEEWSGLAAASPLDANSGVGVNTGGGSACNSGPVTTTNASDWIWSAGGMRCNNSNSPTWGGGSTLDASSGQQITTAVQSVTSTGTYTPTLNYPSAGTLYYAATASMAFKQYVAPTGPQVWVWDGTSTKLAATMSVWDGTSKVAATPRIST